MRLFPIIINSIIKYYRRYKRIVYARDGQFAARVIVACGSHLIYENKIY